MTDAEKSEGKFSAVSRVEVVGKCGREYVRYFEDKEFVYIALQDDDRTLKIFIEDDSSYD